MGITSDGLSCWQADTEGVDLLDLTIGELFDQRADAFAAQEAIIYSCYPEAGIHSPFTGPTRTTENEPIWSPEDCWRLAFTKVIISQSWQQTFLTGLYF